MGNGNDDIKEEPKEVGWTAENDVHDKKKKNSCEKSNQVSCVSVDSDWVAEGFNSTQCIVSHGYHAVGFNVSLIL